MWCLGVFLLLHWVILSLKRSWLGWELTMGWLPSVQLGFQRQIRTLKSFSLVACWAFTSCCFSLEVQLFDSWDTRVLLFIFPLVLAYSKHLRGREVLWICVSLYRMRNIIVFPHPSPCWTMYLKRQSLTLSNCGFQQHNLSLWGTSLSASMAQIINTF